LFILDAQHYPSLGMCTLIEKDDDCRDVDAL